MRSTMEIDQAQEPDYESVKIDYIGFVDPYAVEGMAVLKADNGKEFHMRAFLAKLQNTSQVLEKLKVRFYPLFTR